MHMHMHMHMQMHMRAETETQASNMARADGQGDRQVRSHNGWHRRSHRWARIRISHESNLRTHEHHQYQHQRDAASARMFSTPAPAYQRRDVMQEVLGVAVDEQVRKKVTHRVHHRKLVPARETDAAQGRGQDKNRARGEDRDEHTCTNALWIT
jgi:hypothetical protein